MAHAYRARWSGQGCINKLIIISIVMYALKQIGGGGYSCNLKLKKQKWLANVTLFCGRGVDFLLFGTSYICHTSPTEGGGVQGDLASFTKYAGFFICSLTGVRGILVLISCVCMFVFLSETNLLSLRALSLQL